MSIIRIEDPDGNLMKALVFTDDEDTMQEDETLEYENEHDKLYDKMFVNVNIEGRDEEEN